MKLHVTLQISCFGMIYYDIDMRIINSAIVRTPRTDESIVILMDILKMMCRQFPRHNFSKIELSFGHDYELFEREDFMDGKKQ